MFIHPGVVYGLIWKHCSEAAVVFFFFFAKLPRQIRVSGWGFIFLFFFLLFLLPEAGSGKWLPCWKSVSEALCFNIYHDYFLRPAYSEGRDSRNRHHICGAGWVSISLCSYRKAADLYYISKHVCPAKPWAPQLSLNMSSLNLWNTLFLCSAGTFTRGLRHFSSILQGKKHYSL